MVLAFHDYCYVASPVRVLQSLTVVIPALLKMVEGKEMTLSSACL